jgi:hypothetical protein
MKERVKNTLLSHVPTTTHGVTKKTLTAEE